MGVDIRKAIAQDKQRCMELLAELNARNTHPQAGELFDHLLDGERGEIIVAEDESGLLGMASVSYNLAMRYGGEYCQLEELIVSSQARGKNVGGRLVQQTVINARDRGCGEYGLYLVETTEHNRPFYEKYGFRVVGTEMRQRLMDQG